jgi:hypothetical protein
VALLEDEEHSLAGIEFRDLGESQLKDFQRPVLLYQVIAPQLPAEFPPPRAAAPSHSPLFALLMLIGNARCRPSGSTLQPGV